MEQMKLGDIEEMRRRVRLALWKLRHEGAPHGEELGALSRWQEVDAVPVEQLVRLAEDLEAEARVRAAFGDERYFATRSVADKVGEYQFALAALQHRLQERGDDVLEGGMTWAAFKRELTDCIKKYSETAAHARRCGEDPEAEVFVEYGYKSAEE